MICGVYEADKSARVREETILGMCQSCPDSDSGITDLYIDRNIGLGFNSLKMPVQKNKNYLFRNKDESVFIAFEGNLFNKSEIYTQFRNNGKKFLSDNELELIFGMYEKNGEKCIEQLNGRFIVFILDKNRDRIYVARDHLGIEPLYYYWDGRRFIFSSSLKAVVNHDVVSSKLNSNALYQYLLFNYIPGQDSVYKNIRKLRPGHYISIQNTDLSIKRYWYLSFSKVYDKDERQYRNELLSLMEDAIRIRLQTDGKNIGAFLSGGMDSSSVVGLMSPMTDKPIHTFSFRCKGKSFDESHYAEVVSERYKTQHHLVEFSPEEVSSISRIVDYMDEPFCDIGIEVASYILGRDAERFTPCIMTGDGGDELFGGHPVYLADRVARIFEKVPRFLQKPLFQSLQILPDTDKKRSFVVKAKRFSYSFNFPGELHSNRWRIYYTENELKKLLNSDLFEVFKGLNPLDEIENFYTEADGPDSLSRTLYGDYNTVVGFYLRRMQLLRTFGIDARFPMMDPRLVEYAASIPSELKIKNRSETKYILHKTMAGILPDEIVYRKDKLGHSVPMKNWMRESSMVQELIFDVLSEDSVNRRGYFNSSYVRKLISQHLKKSYNHSHRLWALVVLEFWFQRNIHQLV